MIYSFANDYSEGCHPLVLDALFDSNLVQQAGYGDDDYSKQVQSIVRKLTNVEVDVHMIAGGTLTNLTVLSSLLKPFESVIAASTGHIYVNETGAIEATGHKVEAAHSEDGKLRPSDITPFLNKARGHHVVRTKVVYISNSTELGTIYSKQELIDLSLFCRANSLLLYMDGARLPMALTATTNDLTLADIASLTDIFYIGGTKCGALLGEAVVIVNPDLKADFKYYLKQRGALMAKGRLLGIQFEQLLGNGLILDLAAHANRMALKISDAIERLGYPLLTKSETNQVFPVLPKYIIEKLQNDYEFLIWKPIDSEQSAIRLITSWATPESVVDKFVEDLANL